jgi:hypothetical protein
MTTVEESILEYYEREEIAELLAEDRYLLSEIAQVQPTAKPRPRPGQAKPGPPKPKKERVARVAFQLPDGTIFFRKGEPEYQFSHAALAWAAEDEGKELPEDAIPGFLTNMGRFLNREEAHLFRYKRPGELHAGSIWGEA